MLSQSTIFKDQRQTSHLISIAEDMSLIRMCPEKPGEHDLADRELQKKVQGLLKRFVAMPIFKADPAAPLYTQDLLEP